MWTKRLIALLVAVALVGGAVALRAQIDGNDAAGSSTAPATTADSELVTVVCATELAAACAALDAPGVSTTVERAGTTAARLETAVGADVPDAWLTLAPWPELVDSRRTRDNLPPLFSGSDPIGTSRLGMIGPKDRMSALATACGGSVDAITWRCLGDVAGTPWSSVGGGAAAWGAVKPAHTSPVSDAAGLLVFANAVVSWFGRTDVSKLDFDTDEGFRSWVSRLERAIPTFGDSQTTPLDRLLLLPAVDAVGTTEAEITSKVGAQGDRFTVAYPSPMAQADAVVARTRTLPPGLVATATTAIAGAGWAAFSAASSTGLPTAGAMEALQSVWTEVTR